MNTRRFSLVIIAPLLSSSDVVEVPNADVGSPHPADLNLSRKECHLRNTKKQLGLWWISNLFKKIVPNLQGLILFYFLVGNILYLHVLSVGMLIDATHQTCSTSYSSHWWNANQPPPPIDTNILSILTTLVLSLHVHVVHYTAFCQHMECRKVYSLYSKPWDLKPFKCSAPPWLDF